MIRSNHECRDLVDEALKYKIVPKRRYLLTKINSKSRGVGVIYSVGGDGNNHSAVDTVRIYDPLSDTWSNADHMASPKCVAGAGIAVMQNCLFVVGGSNGKWTGQDCERYSTVEA